MPSPAAPTGSSASGPRRLLADRTHYYAVHAGGGRRSALAALVRIARSPFGFALRGVRDSAAARRRARHRRAAHAMARLRAGGHVRRPGGRRCTHSPRAASRPKSLAIPRSVDALVMVLLGGLNAVFGPLLGAAAFTWLADALAARHRILARAARRVDPVARAGFSDGHRRCIRAALRRRRGRRARASQAQRES